MTYKMAEEYEAELAAAQEKIKRLEHDLDTITVKDSELFQRLELRGRIKELEADNSRLREAIKAALRIETLWIRGLRMPRTLRRGTSIT